MDRKSTLAEIDESDSLVNSIPVPACPGCRMVKNEWPGEGYTHEGETYCCQGCAERTGAYASPSGSRASRASDKSLQRQSRVQASSAPERPRRRAS